MKKIKITGFLYKVNYLLYALFSFTILAISISNILGYALLENLYITTNEIVHNLTPTNISYETSSGVFYVDSSGTVVKFTKEMPNLVLPCCAEYNIENGIINFDVKSDIILRCAGKGIVKKIGYEDGKKYIEIRHSGDVYTRYENVNIVGIISNSLVEQGQIIATLKTNDSFTFKLLKDNQVVTNFVVENGAIVWQD